VGGVGLGSERLAASAARGRTGLLAAVLVSVLFAGYDWRVGYQVRTTEFPWSAAKLTNAITVEVVAAHPEFGRRD
jgi:glycine betaine/proline transport system substrate-binding protein